MTEKLDDLSVQIGRILQIVDESVAIRAKMAEDVSDLKQRLKELDEIKEKIEAIEDHIKMIDGLRNKGVGIVIGVAIAASVFGAGIKAAIVKLGDFIH